MGHATLANQSVGECVDHKAHQSAGASVDDQSGIRKRSLPLNDETHSLPEPQMGPTHLRAKSSIKAERKVVNPTSRLTRSMSRNLAKVVFASTVETAAFVSASQASSSAVSVQEPLDVKIMQQRTSNRGTRSVCAVCGPSNVNTDIADRNKIKIMQEQLKDHSQAGEQPPKKKPRKSRQG